MKDSRNSRQKQPREIVDAKDKEFWPGADGDLRDVGHEVVGRPLRLLADVGAEVRARWVEVAEEHGAPVRVRLADVLDDHLGHVLGHPVGAGDSIGGILTSSLGCFSFFDKLHLVG